MKPETALYRCEQIRACEREAMSSHHVDEHELMQRAGSEAFARIKKIYPHAQHLAVFCGAGNNAGDGYVVARLAHEEGLAVTIYQCKAPVDLPPAAQYAALMASSAGVECQSADESIDSETDLIVDALLGIGLKGFVYGIIAAAINQINDSGLPVIALDVPSGLNADTGCIENLCVKANTTLTFIGLKTGLYTGDALDYCGDIYCCPIQLNSCTAKQKPAARLMRADNLSLPLPLRKKNSHKGDYGHVLVIGGGPGMPGAICLAAKAAMRTGAGAVSIATWPEHARGVLSLIPEAMVWGVDSGKDLHSLLLRTTMCVIGPGLGDSDWAVDLFLEVMRSQLPMVIDASALRLLAEHPQMDDNWILTPHPGEAAALLSCTTEQIQTDRYHAAAAIQKRYGGVVVLKGAGSIVANADQGSFVCTKGNPAMASAGMGDVLSGIIAGLYAQGLSLVDAAQTGVYAHALAGDKMEQSLGGPGLLASDLFDILPSILNNRE